jgi:hypothetical protein
MFVLMHCSEHHHYPLATSDSKESLKDYSIKLGMYSSHDDSLMLPYNESVTPDAIAEYFHYIYCVPHLES